MFLVVFVAFTGEKGVRAAAIEMKLAHFAADLHPGNLASKMFAEGVEKRTNGKIKVTIFPNNALGSPPEVLEQNILGAVDMSLPTQGQLGKYSQKKSIVLCSPSYLATTSMRTKYWTESRQQRRIPKDDPTTPRTPGTGINKARTVL